MEPFRLPICTRKATDPVSPRARIRHKASITRLADAAHSPHRRFEALRMHAEKRAKTPAARSYYPSPSHTVAKSDSSTAKSDLHLPQHFVYPHNNCAINVCSSHALV
jgi:hypothetical protein